MPVPNTLLVSHHGCLVPCGDSPFAVKPPVEKQESIVSEDRLAVRRLSPSSRQKQRRVGGLLSQRPIVRKARDPCDSLLRGDDIKDLCVSVVDDSSVHCFVLGTRRQQDYPSNSNQDLLQDTQLLNKTLLLLVLAPRHNYRNSYTLQKQKKLTTLTNEQLKQQLHIKIIYRTALTAIPQDSTPTPTTANNNKKSSHSH